MGLKRTGDFRQDAVRIALTSRLARKQVADDLGVDTEHLDHGAPRHGGGFERGFRTAPRE